MPKVFIEGTCAPQEVPKLHYWIDTRNNGKRPGPLSFTGRPGGLKLWPAIKFNCVGVAGVDVHTAGDLRRHMEELATVAPSLKLRVHVAKERYDDEPHYLVEMENGVITMKDPELEVMPAKLQR